MSPDSILQLIWALLRFIPLPRSNNTLTLESGARVLCHELLMRAVKSLRGTLTRESPDKETWRTSSWGAPVWLSTGAVGGLVWGTVLVDGSVGSGTVVTTGAGAARGVQLAVIRAMTASNAAARLRCLSTVVLDTMGGG